MTSGGRELLKWLAVALMTGDHVARVFFDGYLPVVSELGRIAFPVFALVMAYNLAQPGADVGKSVRRLLLWGIVAQPAHALAFGYWIPLNVLLSFALAAAAVWCVQGRRWPLAALCVGPAPLLVDYQWAGILLVVAGWAWFDHYGRYAQCSVMVMTRLEDAKRVWSPWLLVLAMTALCVYNGNCWALLALPVMRLGRASVSVPRTRWAFYGYYVGHLALLATLRLTMPFEYLLLAMAVALLVVLVVAYVKAHRRLRALERRLRDRPPAP